MKNNTKILLLSTLLFGIIAIENKVEANEIDYFTRNQMLDGLQNRNYGEDWNKVLHDAGQISVSSAKYLSPPSGYRSITDTTEARDLLNRYYAPNGWLTPVDQYVEQVGDLEIVNQQPISAGHTVVTNDTSQAMNILTPAFEYSKTYTTSTTTTNTFKLGLKTSYSLKIYSATIGTELATEYNFTHAGTKSVAETVKYTIPSQSIPTLPGHSYKVEHILSVGQARGKVRYVGDINGFIPYAVSVNANASHSSRAGNAVLTAERDPQYISAGYKNKFEYKDADNMRYFGGDGSFSAEYGTNSRIKVTDITNGEKNAPEPVYYEIDGLTKEVTEIK
ncbi:ETX/MTX2 family pore-forming toxin [Enterococcus pernyi]|uniref:ETX/MTX2 family pore-forming toxin n=1 Tax=Enterococcus pernyi TaxID=590158 RepID=UPI000789B120|nr:ETX/MTX2 family pore-forming toxin [Enterococcus pernyi]